MSSFTGTSAGDVFTGGAGDDTAFGLAGNDSLSGGDGYDLLVGGAGADTLDGGDGGSTFWSGDQSPPFRLPYFDNPYTLPVLDAGREVDNLRGGSGADTFFAGYGDNVDGGVGGGDHLYISFQGAPAGVVADFSLATQTIGGGVITNVEYVDYVEGSQFADNLSLAAGLDFDAPATVHGRDGDDTITAGYATNAIFGDDGDDVMDGRLSHLLGLVDGGAGNDTIYTNSDSPSRANGGDGDDTIYANDFVHGGAGNDLIVMRSSAYPDQVFGDEGDDTITAAVNASAPTEGDNIAGGSGADVLIGADGADKLFSADFLPNSDVSYFDLLPADDTGLEHDVLSGGGGNDALAIGYGDDADGGAGLDTLRLSLAGLTHGIDFDTSGIVSAQPTSLGGSVIQNIETLLSLHGTEFADTLRLATQASQLTVDAGAGDDLIIANLSSVSVLGGAGDDRFVSGLAADTFDGGAGSDTVDYSGSASALNLALGTGSGAGGDTLISVESVIGSAFNDTLSGDAGGNVIEGGGGNDVMDGGAGVDTASYASATSGVTVHLDLQGQAQATGGAGVDTFFNFEDLKGSAFADALTGDAGDNIIEGGGGSDVLDGAGGVDTASYVSATSGVNVSLALQGQAQATGGAGVDVLSNFENLKGSAFNDTLTGDAGGNLIEGGGGDDVLDGGAGVDTASYASATSGVNVSLVLQGHAQSTSGAGADVLTHFENLTGSAFNDVISGDANSNVLDGGAGIDTVSYASASAGVTVSLALQGQVQATGGAGVDTLSNFENVTGSAFNDVISGDWHDNVLDGGAGIDTLAYAYSNSGVNVSLALQGQIQGGLSVGADIFFNFENLRGSAFDDTLSGDAGANVIEGGDGSDILDGGAGVDTVSYASTTFGVTVSLALQGEHQILDGTYFGREASVLFNFENLTGSSFNDVLAGDANNNVLDGGAGVDTISYASATSAVDVSLTLQGQAQDVGGGTGVDTLSNFENVTGSAFSDTLTGDGAANFIDGGAGDDILDGGAGADSVSYASATGGVKVSLALQGHAQGVGGGAGVDVLSNFEGLTGSAFGDTLAGDASDNVLDGGAGGDTVTYEAATAEVSVSLALHGQAQNTGGAGVDTLSNFENLTGSAFGDVLTGDASDNVLSGGAGADTLNGGQGIDTLIGGAGNDHFSFAADPSSWIHIADFEVGKDVLDLSAYFARLDYSGSDPVADHLIAFASDGAGGTRISVDPDGDGAGASWRDPFIDLDNVSPAGLTWAQLITPVRDSPPPPGGGGGGGNGGGGGSGGGGSVGGDQPIVTTVTDGASVQGGAGADTLTGGGDRDTMFGGDGADQIVGGPGFNQVNGNKGDDVIIGKSLVGDWLLGGQGNDQIDASASSGKNILNGNIGADIVVGGSGGDFLRGGQGDDAIRGGSGADWISGDKGADTLAGGGGADIFHAPKGGGADVVIDFSVADGDRIQLDPGTAYIVRQLGADTVVDLGDGDEMILLNIPQASLQPGWIFGA